MKNLSINQGVLIAIVIILSAFVFLMAARGFSDQGKFVEVKGSSERFVKADRAIWSFGYEVKSNDVNNLYSEIANNNASIKKFLTDAGFKAEEINIAPISVYQDTYREALYRYNTSVQLSVFTENVDLVRKVSSDTLPLIKAGIVLNGGYVDFQFTELNTIKPAMLAEAIAGARESAQQFADDSGTRLGSISRANQGVFSITEKDPGSPEFKAVRVVSTVRYLLK